MRRLVSVIIPNYNYGRYLSEALESVLGQSYPYTEVIVVDDGSTDNSEAVARSYGKRVKWVQQQRQGVSAARNRGTQESQGELIAFLDPDDVWLPTKLERQLHRFLNAPELGLVHCGVEEIDETGRRLSSRLDGLQGWVAKEMLLLRQAAIIGAGSTAMVLRDTFDTIGGFDGALSTSADWDFCYRVAIRQQVGFVPEVLVRYRRHRTNMHANISVMERDMLIAYAKAFNSPDPEIQELRRQSYGNLHMTLAGSFFRAGQQSNFARHALKSLWLTPGNLTRLLGFPLRRWRS